MAFQRRRVDHREDARAGEADQSDQRQHSHGTLYEVLNFVFIRPLKIKASIIR